jgi:acyl carrier protein
MENNTNNTSSKIISTTIKNNSLEIVNQTKLKPNNDKAITWSSEIQSLELLMGKVGNFQDCSNQICQNWLKAHETDSLCSKNIKQYKKIIILLKDIVELIEGTKTTIQCAQLQKLEISKTVGTIVSNCLDIELDQVIVTANFANDLGIDSLDWLELLITLEETFAITISDEIAGTLVTVQQLIDYIVLIVQQRNRLSYQEI